MHNSYSFVWLRKVRNRFPAIKFAIKNLWNAFCGYELSIELDLSKICNMDQKPKCI